MIKQILLILVFFFTISPIEGKSLISPEAFGAKGDGIADDTKFLQKALDSGLSLQLDGTYLITKSITFKGNVYGKGKILFGKNDVSLYCSSDGITIKGITFDYQQHEGKIMRLVGARNISIESCEFLNLGNHSSQQSEGMILITKGSHHIHINKCRFIHCYSSSEFSSAGVWVNFSNTEDRCHHIYIDRSYFDDFQPSNDADAIKILGQNEDVFAYITNCEFHRCDKRALKFQARECHSKNNRIFCTRPMYCAIDFQRGHGSSTNDHVVINYDKQSSINPNSGLLYRAICIAQGNVSIKGLKVINENSVDNNHQIAICLQSFSGYDDGTVSNIIFDKCSFDGQQSFMTATDSIMAISNVNLKRSSFMNKRTNNSNLNINNQCKATLKQYLKM